MRNRSTRLNGVLIISGFLALVYVSKISYLHTSYNELSLESASIGWPLIILGLLGLSLLSWGLVRFVRSGNRLRRLLLIGAALLLLVVGHIVPIYSKVGYVVAPTQPGEIGPGLCSRFDQPETEQYRVVFSGSGDFNQLKHHLQVGESSFDDTCNSPIKLQLYLW